jgi:hypothetical protein
MNREKSCPADSGAGDGSCENILFLDDFSIAVKERRRWNLPAHCRISPCSGLDSLPSPVLSHAFAWNCGGRRSYDEICRHVPFSRKLCYQRGRQDRGLDNILAGHRLKSLLYPPQERFSLALEPFPGRITYVCIIARVECQKPLCYFQPCERVRRRPFSFRVSRRRFLSAATHVWSDRGYELRPPSRA